MTSNQVMELVHQVAALYPWPPSVINHLSISELLFWRSNWYVTQDPLRQMR